MIRRISELWPTTVPYWGVLFFLGMMALFRKATILQEVYSLGPSEIWSEIARLPATVDPGFAAAFIIFAGFFYGTRRIYAFHPVFHAPYLGWISLTPYDGRQPLPLGPVHLGLWDIPFLALVSVPTVYVPWMPWYGAAMIVVTGYLILTIGIIQVAVSSNWSRVVIALLACVAALLHYPWLAAIVLLGVYILAHVLIKRTLSREALNTLIGNVKREDAYLLYEGARQQASRCAAEPASVFAGVSQRIVVRADSARPTRSNTDPTETANLGWPLAILGPYIHSDEPPAYHRFLNALLAGGWTFAFAHYIYWENMSDIVVLQPFVLSVCAIPGAWWRLSRYVSGAKSPLTLVGRLGTGRLVIPGYDRLFAFPIAGILAPWVIVPGLHLLGVNQALNLALCVAICWHLLFNSSPRPKSWILTGRYRVEFGTSRNAMDDEKPLKNAGRSI